MVHRVLHLRYHASRQSEEVIEIALPIANHKTALRQVLQPV